MENLIARLLSDFENGKMTRRQLIQSLALAAMVAPMASAAGELAPATAPVAPLPPAPWETVWLDTEGVKAELEKRGLKPTPDMVGADFKSYHVKDPDGWDLQISNKTKG